ncbi:MAG: cupin domain-containing protein [Asticcacaulis sp.]|nr:cupin domain-containing protein [Asticcacaulis sp.]
MQTGQTIRRKGATPAAPGPEACFTGNVTVEMLFTAMEGSNVTGGLVTFAPGARTAWHTHPMGQNLIVLSGTGWTQCEGGLKKEIRAGDMVSCACGLRHWHGATATTAMSHIAITEVLNGIAVTWMEKVSDADYLAPVEED